MEPLKPETRRKILKNNPQSTDADIQEYQRLLAQRFRIDPSHPKGSAVAAADQEREARLTELRQRLALTPPKSPPRKK